MNRSMLQIDFPEEGLQTLFPHPLKARPLSIMGRDHAGPPAADGPAEQAAY